MNYYALKTILFDTGNSDGMVNLGEHEVVGVIKHHIGNERMTYITCLIKLDEDQAKENGW